MKTTAAQLTEIGLAPPAWSGSPSAFPVPGPSDVLRDRYRGCLVAGAIGDALGRPAEGRSAVQMWRRYEGGLREFQPWRGYRSGPVGTFTDDTQLTLVNARWLAEAGSGELDPDLLADAIEVWGRTGRGIGRATYEALANLSGGRRWWASGAASAGNGAAMRAAPYALRFAGRPDELRFAAALGTVPTHADLTAVASAIVQASAVNQCLASRSGSLDPDQLLGSVVASVDDLDLPRLAHRGNGSRRSLAERIGEVKALLGAPVERVLGHFYNGAFVLETMPVVLWLLLTYADDPEEGLVAAVMGGRDADTIAAILGNLLGALHGVAAFPARWRGENLEAHDELLAWADRLYRLRWVPENDLEEGRDHE
ncbi:ADP-ribosylglycohydrolase family protein [Nocardioides panacis]|uniref:ADP-ribosylglycohydrolase family protein n=1 Tax=Nocardioides panacis TaxID=2849501 RepID=A0A975T1P3_9ACTN|nr:ADP-ribosylglycohydrolase family protein [Nocardioides panacis]QWZ09243.1 ADP-ribosylglycohydrolase family protein [Nocardioides panacis]